jgi:hypothetical protein
VSGKLNVKRPDSITNEQERQEFRHRIVTRCRDLLEGRIGVIEASRELSRSRFEADAETDPDLGVFVAIDSETNHLPVGTDRREWAPDALEAKDREIREYEQASRDDAYRAARSLLKKYS